MQARLWQDQTMAYGTVIPNDTICFLLATVSRPRAGTSTLAAAPLGPAPRPCATAAGLPDAPPRLCAVLRV